MSNATSKDIPFGIERGAFNSMGIQSFESGLAAGQGFGLGQSLNCSRFRGREEGNFRIEARPMSADFPLYNSETSLSRLGLLAELLFFYDSKRTGLSERFSHRLVELMTLQIGWDGEKAKSPKPEVLARMVGFLMFLKRETAVFLEPFLTPTVEGYAQLEWHDAQRDLDIEATAQGWSITGSEVRAGQSRVYFEADACSREAYKIVEAYSWFAERKLTWPMI